MPVRHVTGLPISATSPQLPSCIREVLMSALAAEAIFPITDFIAREAVNPEKTIPSFSSSSIIYQSSDGLSSSQSALTLEWFAPFFYLAAVVPAKTSDGDRNQF